CCVSSGPRGLALAPQLTFLKGSEGGKDTLHVNLFEASTLTLELGGQPVTVTQRTDFPRAGRNGGVFTGRTRLIFRMEKPASFGVRLRAPAWAGALGLQASRDDTTVGVQIPTQQQARWLPYPRFERVREWRDGDHLEYEFEIPV